MQPTETTATNATDAAAPALERKLNGRRLANHQRAARTRRVARGMLYLPPLLRAKAARPVNGAFGRRDAPPAPPPPGASERRALARAARRALSGR